MHSIFNRRNWVQIAAISSIMIFSHWSIVFGNDDNWTQWGGAQRNFNLPSLEISDEMSVKEIWQRDLGNGYSAILVEGDRLYTMYREADDEFAICLDSKTGEPVWSKGQESKLAEDADTSFGKGPNSTPIIVGDYLLTVGFNSDLICFDKSSGEIKWKTNLVNDHGGTPVQFGYSASPLHYDGTIILPVGGSGKAVMAFNVSDGTVAWSAEDFKNSYSTPLMATVDGLDQVIFAMTDEIISISPKDGRLLWSFPLKNEWNTHAFVPVWDAKNKTLFVSSFRQSHALKLTRDSDTIKFEKLWSVEKTGIGFTNAVQLGNVIYGTTGGARSPLVTAIDLNDGKILWKERGFGVSNYLATGNRIIILDEKGTLAIARPDANGLGVLGKQELFEAEKGWTVPTMVGQTIYVRDQNKILAVELK